MALLLGIDTGGTYTDAVALDPERGVVAKAKAYTTRHDLSIGVRNAVQALDVAGRAAQVQLVSLSTTLATNAIVEGRGCRAALLLFGYDPASLEREGLSSLVPRDLVACLPGGHTVDGDEREPLDEAATRAAIARLAPKVEAFAVSAFFSPRDPGHEQRVRDWVREMTGLPVTCGHELASALNAPRRAVTTALNARLIPLIDHLVRAVRETLDGLGIAAPLMVVKGDGSLISAAMALERPVETILSGPAASAVGSQYLAGAADGFLLDMGGTTTDITVIERGRPTLNRGGAVVGQWQTMVEAIDVRTTGLGGDSEVRLEDSRELCLGPRRVIPLCLLADEYPSVITRLAAGASQRMDRDTGTFVLRGSARPDAAGRAALVHGSLEAEVMDLVGAEPLALADLVQRTRVPSLARRTVHGLAARGLLAVSGFTPTDAVNVLGHYCPGNRAAALAGAEAWGRLLNVTAAEFAAKVVERAAYQLGQAVVASALATDRTGPDRLDEVSRLLIARGLDGAGPGSLGVAFALRRPLVAIGAPVATYLPAVSNRLAAELIIPQHAEVGNAVGAVAGRVIQRVRVLIRPAQASASFRAFLPGGHRDFETLAEAADAAREAVCDAAQALALAAAGVAPGGSPAIQVTVEQVDRFGEDGGGRREDVFLETEVVATATARPWAAG